MKPCDQATTAREQLAAAAKEREKSNMELSLLRMKLQRAEELLTHQENQAQRAAG